MNGVFLSCRALAPCYASQPLVAGLGDPIVASAEPETMWHLIEDFFEQGLIVKLFLGVGWLAVVIMLASFVTLLLP